MKIRQIQFLIILILIQVPNLVFGQEYSHQDQVKYYGIVASQMKEFKESEQILSLLKQIMAKSELGKFQDAEKLDSINILVNEVVINIDLRIKILDNLKNADDEKYKIKENVLNYIKFQKESLQIMLPLLLKGIKYGENSITEIEKNSVKKYLQEDSRKERDRVNQLLYHFENLHEISVNELKKYDL